MRLQRLLLVFSPLLSLCLVVGCSPAYDQDLLRAGQFERKGDCTSALALYEAALSKIPADHPLQQSAAYFRAGGCSLKLQHFKQAFENYQKAVDFDPTNIDARLHLAELFVMGGLPRQALPHIESALTKKPEDAAALSLLGSIEAEAGNNQKAIEFFEHALRNDPNRESTSVALAELYNRSDHADRARSVLQRATVANPKKPTVALALGRLEEQEGNPRAAEDAYRLALKADDSRVTNLRLAQFLQRAGRVAEAEQALRHLDSLQPASPSALADFQLSAGRPDFALRRYLETENHAAPSQKGGHSAAAALAARLVETQLQTSASNSQVSGAESGTPISPAAARSLLEKHRPVLDQATIAILEAEIALAEGDMPQAEMKSAIACNRAPDSAAAHYVRGVIFRREEKVAEAKEEWNSALAIDPGHLPSRLALATQTLEENDAATADEQVSAVVRDEPGNVAALNLYARVLLAERRFAPAHGILSRALGIASNNLESQVILGDINMAQHRYSLALIAYEKALVTHPASAEALHGLLSVYRKGTITRPVLVQMEKVANAPPASASLMEVAGRLYEEHGWHVDALRALRRAVEIDAHRSTATLALINAYYAKGDAVQANHAVLSAQSLDGIISTAAAMLEAGKAEQQGDDTTAIRNYESAVKSGETSGAAANNLAWIYAKQGANLDRALTLARSAVDRNPKNPAMLDTLGVIYLKLRDYSSAAETLRRAVSIAEKKDSSKKTAGDATHPELGHAELYQHLAAAYTGAGLIREASAASAKAQKSISR